jgi:FtsP/CotA-like multicopper oxidase with cupredoxin domain
MSRFSWLAVALVASGCGPKTAAQGEFELLPIQVEPAPPVVKPLPEVWGSPALEDVNPDPKIVEVNLRAVPTTLNIDDNRSVRGMYTFNGMYPGPTLKAKKGDRIIVHFKNDLPEPTTIHWHGLRISDQMDGSPRIQAPIKPGESFTYDYVAPDPGSFWYHPHVRAGEQVEKGLYAPIVIEDDEGVDPTFDLERSVMVDDMLISGGDFEAFGGAMEAMMGGRLGNVLITNGKVQGRGLNATAKRGQVERWRVVNPSNARTMELSLDGARFFVIGTDGGWLSQPYAATKLIVAVGQRYDLMVVYDNEGPVKLLSHVDTVDNNNNVVNVAIPVMTVDVGPGGAPQLPVILPRAELDRPATKTAEIVIDAVNDPQMGFMWRLNGKGHGEGGPLFTFEQGDTVKLSLTNKEGVEHPFHLHGQFFTIRDLKEPGLKDVVLIPPQSSREVIAYFDNPGHWMAHCHILEHAEYGMMGEIYVNPKPQ